MTLTEAALATNSSVRTVYRRINAGQLQTRRDGRHTLVEIDAAVPATSDIASDSSETPAYSTENKHTPVATARSQTPTVNAPADKNEEAVDWKNLALANLKTSLRGARISYRLGWSAVAVAVPFALAVSWKYHRAEINHREQLADVNQSLADTSAHASSLEASLNRIESNNRALNQQMAEVQERLTQVTADLKATLVERDRLAKDLDKASASLEANKYTVHELESNLESALQQRDALALEAISLKEHIECELAALTTLQDQVQQMAGERDDLNQRVAAMQSRLESEHRAVAGLATQVASVDASQKMLSTNVETMRRSFEGELAANVEILQDIDRSVVALQSIATDRDRLASEVKAARMAMHAWTFVQNFAGALATRMETTRSATASHHAAESFGPTPSVASEAPAQSPEPEPTMKETPKRPTRITISVPSTRPASDIEFDWHPPLPVDRTASASLW